MRISHAMQGYEIWWLSEGNSPVTITVYKSALLTLADYLADPEITQITEQDLQRFFAHLNSSYRPHRSDAGQLSQASLHRYHKAVRSFFKWAEQEQGTGRPDLQFKTPRYANKEIIPYTEEQAQRLLRAAAKSQPVEKPDKKAYQFECANAARNQAILMVLLDTGIRPSELCRLRVADINLASGEIQVVPWRKGKTRPRTVRISPRTCKAIWKYWEQIDVKRAPAAFLTLEGNPMERHTVGSFFADLGRRAGVAGANPYRCRHTFAIQYLRNGGDVYTLQYILGHATLDMCKNYLRIAQTDIETAHRRASPVDRWKL